MAQHDLRGGQQDRLGARHASTIQSHGGLGGYLQGQTVRYADGACFATSKALLFAPLTEFDTWLSDSRKTAGLGDLKKNGNSEDQGALIHEAVRYNGHGTPTSATGTESNIFIASPIV